MSEEIYSPRLVCLSLVWWRLLREASSLMPTNISWWRWLIGRMCAWRRGMRLVVWWRGLACVRGWTLAGWGADREHGRVSQSYELSDGPRGTAGSLMTCINGAWLLSWLSSGPRVFLPPDPRPSFLPLMVYGRAGLICTHWFCSGGHSRVIKYSARSRLRACRLCTRGF